MFKRGGRLAARPSAASTQQQPGGAAGGGSSGGASSRRGAKGEGLEAKTAALERKVANCLACGRIFDCRNVTNDILRFIGACVLGVCGCVCGGVSGGALEASVCEPAGACSELSLRALAAPTCTPHQTLASSARTAATQLP
jgi:hypothetical protein